MSLSILIFFAVLFVLVYLLRAFKNLYNTMVEQSDRTVSE